jgi:hypothetical protein
VVDVTVCHARINGVPRVMPEKAYLRRRCVLRRPHDLVVTARWIRPFHLPRQIRRQWARLSCPMIRGLCSLTIKTPHAVSVETVFVLVATDANSGTLGVGSY